MPSADWPLSLARKLTYEAVSFFKIASIFILYLKIKANHSLGLAFTDKLNHQPIHF